MATMIPNQTDKCTGAMIATAIGDALGWPNECRSKNKVKSFDVDGKFIEWTRQNTKPCYHDERILPGEYSDDTQLTLSVARSIIVGNWEKFLVENELPFWLRYERGGGSALIRSANSYRVGILPFESKNRNGYINAGGNGVAMRILPHVIANTKNPNSSGLMADVIKDALITHGHPRAILGATCYAFALNYLLRKTTVLEYSELVSAVIGGQDIWGAYLGSFDNQDFNSWLKSVNEYGSYEYYSEWEHVRHNMLKQLGFIANALKQGLILDDVNVMNNLECFSKVNGAGDVATLTAIYFASKYANNPILGIKIPAYSFGIDTDTIASMTGGLLGMLCGTNWIPNEWKKVQDYDCLIRITRILVADDKKRASKEDTDSAKAMSKEYKWINTPIGQMRMVNTSTIKNGAHNSVIITKYQSVLGQTIYIKKILKFGKDTMKRDAHLQISFLSDISNTQAIGQISKQFGINNSTREHVNKTERRFVLVKTNINELLNNPLLGNNIRTETVLSIIGDLIEDDLKNTAIASKYGVSQAIVDLISTYVIR